MDKILVLRSTDVTVRGFHHIIFPFERKYIKDKLVHEEEKRTDTFNQITIPKGNEL